ncbi:MAG TPA: hypothetical protein VK171_10690 [Fimbriimonas sp.]|nr:hypothetical protein [Fimbriimonas sp.]
MLISTIDPVYQVREANGTTIIGYLPWNLFRGKRFLGLVIAPFLIAIIVNLWAAYQPAPVRSTVTIAMLLFMFVFGFGLPFWILRQLQTIELDDGILRLGSPFEQSEKRPAYSRGEVDKVMVVSGPKANLHYVTIRLTCGTQKTAMAGVGLIAAESLASFLEKWSGVES